MRGIAVKCEPLTGNYQFELYLRDEQQSYGPVYVAVPTKYISTRKFLFNSKDEAAHAVNEMVQKKPELKNNVCFKPSGNSRYVIEVRGKELEDFLGRYYPGCFKKAGNADYMRAIAGFPFFCLNFDDVLSLCLLRQKDANKQLRKIYDELLFPMRLEGKSHKDVLKRLKKPDSELEEKLKSVKSSKSMIDTWLHERGKSEIEFMTLKIYLDSMRGIKFENGA